MDHAEKIAHVVGGMMFGGIASAVLVAETFFTVMITEKGTLWIPGGIFLGSTALCGLLGGIFGAPFVDWMSENYAQFWRNHHHH